MALVLVIDDDASVRSVARVALTRAGHEVRCAADGGEGERAYRESPADVVVCDLYMPDRDGLETIRALSRAFPGVRVVATSGGGTLGRTYDMLSVARHLGAVSALEKPFSRDELLLAVEGALAAAGEAPP